MAQKSWQKTLKVSALNWLQRFIEFITHALFSIVYGGPGKKMPPIDNLLLLDSATTLALKIRTRKVTSEEVVKTFIARINQINPILNCVVDDRFEDAIEDAKQVDLFIASGAKTEQEIERDTPFLGVPFSTKDCLKIKDLLHTAGLHARRHIRADKDAVAIAALRKAGGIPFALTNVSECCMWWESNNPVHGRTHNPYNTNHIVGGSSGGEGCLLAAAGSPIGVGSDIGGSIRIPAALNGIFGHKPSRGIVSNEGQYPKPLNKDQDMFLGVGPMSRFASDLLPALKLMVGANASKLKLDQKVDMNKVKFYYMEDGGAVPCVSRVDPEIKAALRRVVLHLDKAHGVKAQKVNVTRLTKQTAIWIARMKADKAAPTFAAQLTNLNGEISVLTEMLKWTICMSNYTIVGILTAMTEQLGIEYGSSAHAYLLEECSKMTQEFKDMLGDDGVFLYPTHPTPAPYHIETLSKPFNFAYAGIVNVMGFPATHCPLGLHSGGLPIGIQVMGGVNNDHLCLAVASELERAFGGWVPPTISV